jgi:dynein heavy chain
MTTPWKMATLLALAGIAHNHSRHALCKSPSYTQVLKQAGGAAQPTVFLFSDTQLKEESFLEDLNNILNTGEVGGSSNRN